MKIENLSLLLILVYLFTMTGCATSGGINQSLKAEKDLTLKQHLQKKGVVVDDSGITVKVYIQGQNLRSNKTRQPLFVIDGEAVGRSYSEVDSMLSSNNIESVEVLTSAEAARWGDRGVHGVIIIHTSSI